MRIYARIPYKIREDMQNKQIIKDSVFAKIFRP
jgi:hypothetical protein